MKAKGLPEGWRAYRMAWEKPLEGCHHEVNRVRCGQHIDGQGASRYCSPCRPAAQKKDKQIRNAVSNAERKATEGFHEDNRHYRLLSHYGLTKPKLESLFKNAETHPEEHIHKDDFAEDASKKIEAIKELIIQPLAGLPPAAKAARKNLQNLLTSLEEREQHYGPDVTITQLKLSARELDRDIGMWDSGKALTTISGKAKKVQKLMHKHNELYGFIHALLARAEIFRIKYFSTGPEHFQEQFLVEALRWLNYAEDVCEQALKRRLTDERKQMALYLRLYIELIKVRLAFDAKEEGQVEQAGKYLKKVDKMAAAVEDAYGEEGQVVATASFVTSISHTEYDLRRRNLDSSADRLKNVVKIFPTMGFQSIESTHRVGVGPAFVQKITGVGESVSGNHPVRSFRTHHQSDRVFRIRF
jgi:hypothetical protein